MEKEIKFDNHYALVDGLKSAAKRPDKDSRESILSVVKKEIVDFFGQRESEKVPEKVPEKVKRQPKTLQALENEQKKEALSEPLSFEIRPPGEGLDKRIGWINFHKTLNNELINKFNVSPVLIANSVGKKGIHPFYRGSAAYIWYLPKERRSYYLSKLFAYDAEYSTVSDLIGFDENREKWEEVGIDIDFVTSVLTDDEVPVLRDEPEKDEDPTIIEKVKALGGFGKMTQSLGEEVGPKLVRFMCRFGINQQVLVDLLHILEKHKEEPNVYIV